MNEMRDGRGGGERREKIEKKGKKGKIERGKGEKGKEEREEWWHAIAKDIIRRKGMRNLVVATGITPSGAIHIGNLRETLIADAVCNALRENGAEASLIYIADTYDPLRRLYPFLPPDYKEHVGKPLSDIPDPDGCHSSYSEHFLQPFLAATDKLGISMKVFRADEMYKRGMYEDAIRLAIKERERIMRIIAEVTGRDLQRDWYPFMPVCKNCGRMNATDVLKCDLKRGECVYRCNACGYEGFASLKNGGKLTWRVDWAARWKILNVAVEPFGKDHASAGGSYETGKRISEEIYGYEAPYPIPFEHVLLKVGGKVEAMSSSKGTNISVDEILTVVPPEVLKFIMLRVKPMKHIEFDPSMGLLNLIDEYEREIAPIGRGVAAEIPFRHFITLVQVARGDINNLLKIIRRSGFALARDEEQMKTEIAEIQKKARYAENWLRKFAQPDVKFEIKDSLPELARSLSQKQKEALKMLSEEIKKRKLSAEDYHNKIYEVAENLGISAKEVFRAVYIALLGRDSGPRAGWLLASLQREFLVKRFEDAAKD